MELVELGKRLLRVALRICLVHTETLTLKKVSILEPKITNTERHDRDIAGVKMSVEDKLMERAGLILRKEGHAAVEIAKRVVLEEEIGYAPLSDALRYFILEWNDVLHPALVSLACEAVGGEAKDTEQIGAALVLMAGAADIHDDIIDGSLMKEPRQTIFGKFGKDLAILTGDLLLFKGISLLHEACEKLEQTKRNSIFEAVKRAFSEISSAEAAEASMRGRIDLSKQQYFDIIRGKVAAGEASMRIGALLGGGSVDQVKILADYGRTYGFLLTLRDEFVDMFEQDELGNRIEKEILPLPIMVSLTDKSRKTRLLQLLQGNITEYETQEIVDVVTGSKETDLLVAHMKQLVNKLVDTISPLQARRGMLELLARAVLEDL